MKGTLMNYSATADRLVEHIVALIPTHPEVLLWTSPCHLFTLPDFESCDLQPSVFQATWALREAQRIYRDNKAGR